MDCDTPVVFPAPATELSTEDEIKSTIKDLETARNRIQEFEGQINTIMSDVSALNDEKSMNMITAKVAMLTAYIFFQNAKIFESTKLLKLLQEVSQKSSSSTSIKDHAGKDDCLEACKVKETDLSISKVAESRQDFDSSSKLNKESSCLTTNDESSLKFFIDSFERAFSIKMWSMSISIGLSI